MITVLVVDDHIAVRQVVRALLERSGEIKVVGEAADGEGALAAIGELHPDVVILDALMPRVDGFDVLKALKDAPNKPGIVMLSMNDTSGTVKRAIVEGANAFVSKKHAHVQLLQTVREVGSRPHG